MTGSRWQSSVEELLRELSEAESMMRRTYATVLELVAELDTRGAALECGYRSLPELLKDTLRINRTEATRRVRHAHAVTDVELPSGGSVPAPLPRTSLALREGEVAADHLDVIAKTLSDLPLHIQPQQYDAAEASLVDAARQTDPRTLATFATQVRGYLDQDGPQPTDTELAQPTNELHLTTKRNGRVAFTGELEPEAGALFRAALSPLAKPRPSAATGPDPRAPAERQGDALADLIRLAAGTGGLPSEAGEKPHLTVTIPLALLSSAPLPLRPATLEPPTPDSGNQPTSGRPKSGAPDHGPPTNAQREAEQDTRAVLDGVGRLDAASARRIACDSKIIPAVLGSNSEVLDLGRASYTVNHAIRRALVLRDRGCAFPDCDRPHQWQCHLLKHHRWSRRCGRRTRKAAGRFAEPMQPTSGPLTAATSWSEALSPDSSVWTTVAVTCGNVLK